MTSTDSTAFQITNTGSSTTNDCNGKKLRWIEGEERPPTPKERSSSMNTDDDEDSDDVFYDALSGDDSDLYYTVAEGARPKEHNLNNNPNNPISINTPALHPAPDTKLTLPLPSPSVNDVIILEWEDDVNDPFEKVLARLTPRGTTPSPAQSQTEAVEGKETHTAVSTATRENTGGSDVQDSKIGSHDSEEEKVQDKDENTRRQSIDQDKEGQGIDQRWDKDQNEERQGTDQEEKALDGNQDRAEEKEKEQDDRRQEFNINILAAWKRDREQCYPDEEDKNEENGEQVKELKAEIANLRHDEGNNDSEAMVKHTSEKQENGKAQHHKNKNGVEKEIEEGRAQQSHYMYEDEDDGRISHNFLQKCSTEDDDGRKDVMKSQDHYHHENMDVQDGIDRLQQLKEDDDDDKDKENGETVHHHLHKNEPSHCRKFPFLCEEDEEKYGMLENDQPQHHDSGKERENRKMQNHHHHHTDCNRGENKEKFSNGNCHTDGDGDDGNNTLPPAECNTNKTGRENHRKTDKFDHADDVGIGRNTEAALDNAYSVEEISGINLKQNRGERQQQKDINKRIVLHGTCKKEKEEEQNQTTKHHNNPRREKDEEKHEEKRHSEHHSLEYKKISQDQKDISNRPHPYLKNTVSRGGGNSNHHRRGQIRRYWRDEHTNDDYKANSHTMYNWSHMKAKNYSKENNQGHYRHPWYGERNSEGSYYFGHKYNTDYPWNSNSIHHLKRNNSIPLSAEALAEKLIRCESFSSTFEELLKYYKQFELTDIMKVAEAHPKVFKLSTSKVEFKPQVKVCPAYVSESGCPKLRACSDLHICDGFISNRCHERPCPLGHSFQTDHNSAILELFSLSKCPSHTIQKLLCPLSAAASPLTLDVCQDYNQGWCNRANNCQALHLCLSFVCGWGKCTKGDRCQLNHDLETQHCTRLLSTHGISTNEAILDIIVALRRINPSLAAAKTTMPSTPARLPSTSISQEAPDTKKTATFVSRVKQKFGINLDSSGNQKEENQNKSQRNKNRTEECPSFYKDDSDSELGAVGGRNPSNNKSDYGQHRSRPSSSSKSNGSSPQQAGRAHHHQSNTIVTEICRFSLEGVCMKKDKGCSRLHASLPFHWQVCNTKRTQESWIDLPDSVVSSLEAAYCDPARNGVKLSSLTEANLRHLGNLLSNDTWYANFEAMVLTNSDYSRVVVLRRLCVQAGAQAPYARSRTFIWYFCDVNGQWTRYGKTDSTGQKDRTSSITSSNIESHYQARPHVPLAFKVGQFKYHINFASMTQTNLNTKVERAVRRRPELYRGVSAEEAQVGSSSGH